jgi:16S rRNA (guanine527-N7)-methyltransferase
VTDIVEYLRQKAARALLRSLTTTEVDQSLKYLRLLMKWQSSQRLVGSSDPEWIVDNVIADSLLFARALPPGVSTLCDLGSGAGLPGVPLKIVMPDVNVTLLESRARRASFLSAVVRELPLLGCHVVNRRFEDLARDAVSRFDAVVMRCAGDPLALVDQIAPIIAPHGILIASGPPKATALPAGEWLEVDGPVGRRRFWLYRTS